MSLSGVIMGSIFEYLKENFDYREDPKWKPKTYKAVAKIIGISQTKAYKWGYDRKLKGEHKVDGRKTWRKQKLQLEKKTSSFTNETSKSEKTLSQTEGVINLFEENSNYDELITDMHAREGSIKSGSFSCISTVGKFSCTNNQVRDEDVESVIYVGDTFS